MKSNLRDMTARGGIRTWWYKFIFTGFKVKPVVVWVGDMVKGGDSVKIRVCDIIHIGTDEETDLCVLETLGGYVYCYETTEEVCDKINQVGGLQWIR